MSDEQSTTVVQYPIMTDDTGRAIAAALHAMRTTRPKAPWRTWPRWRA